jgi:hypothetical protein
MVGGAQIRRRPKQLSLPTPNTWGGRRTGAGRKPRPGRRATPHRARPLHKEAHPLHLTLRARSGLPSLRSRRVFVAVRNAIAHGSSTAFRIVHFSVQGDHLHLMVEAADTASLCAGARGLSVRTARAVNKALGRTGSVWGDRYHSRALTTPREVRNGLVYVLMNIRKHHRGPWDGLDPCSSAIWFDGFQERVGPSGLPAPVWPPQTWLATEGWRRHGLIDASESPKVLK